MATKLKRDINDPIELEVLKQNAQLGNVPNVTTNDQTPTWSVASVLTNIVSGEKLTIIMGKISKAINDIISHIGNKSNPHGITKSQIGLSNVDNTADINKSVNYATSAAEANSKATMLINEDLNDLKGFNENRAYYSSGSNSVTNKPKDVDAFGLKVYRTAMGYYYQELIGANRSENKKFGRTWMSDAWTPWEKIYSESQKPTKSDIGLSNVENKSSATIRSEITKDNVTNALGYTPPTTDTKYEVATNSQLGLVKSGTDITVDSNGNVSVNRATKLSTPRNISLSQGASGSVNFDGSSNASIPVNNIKESYLEWGGKNFAGKFGCLDAAMISELGANRLQFAKSEGITVEYSRDNGSTWIDYGLSDYQKTALFSNRETHMIIGKSSSPSETTSACKLRITIDTKKAMVYTELNKLYMYINTNGSVGSNVTIDRALESTPTKFETIASAVPIEGWSGCSIINIPATVTYGNTPSSQYGRIRFTFGIKSHESTKYLGLIIQNIKGFGGVGWNTPSTMASTGHLYDYDASQNAIFPANIRANGNKNVITEGDSRLTNSRPASDVYSWAKQPNKPKYSYNELTDKPIIPSGVQVVDNLISTLTTASLSANQGRILKERVDKKVVVSKTQPSGQQIGDTWYQII